MLENQTAMIISALGTCFDRVLDLFDCINIAEHQNELLCFAGIDSYKLSEPFKDRSGAQKRTAEVRYLIKALAKKGMSAADICGIFDGRALAAVEGCGVDVKEIKRNPCTYSKEQGAYVVSAELTVMTDEPEECTPKSIDFKFGNVTYTCMRSFEISRVVKISETPTIGGGIRTRTVGVRPVRITVKGELSEEQWLTEYAWLSSGLGATGLSITVAGKTFSGLAITKLDLGGTAGDSLKLTVEFTEVTEA